MSIATLRPPEAAGLGRGLVFALIAHGLLILALSYGLHWRSDSSAAFEAELWSAVPQVAAPREETPPEPEPEAPPKPDLKAQQRAAEAAAAEQREAEIAIARAKKIKEEKAREDAAKLEREKAAKEKAAKDAKDKAVKEKAAKEEQDRKKAQDAKAAKEAKEADARREAQRQENRRRIQGMAGGTPGSTGTAAQNSAPSAGYAGRIKGKIRPLIIYSDDGATNPMAEVQVTLGPDGRILGTKVLKASGDGDWDRAVLRAIEKAETLPRDVDGRVPPVLILSFRPRE
ncbi:MAG TPA: cell envelope integrity protein TolA [Roseateles sp.]|uniref:cell envelope integrity protein TolA n=1 Tax=Roseateles sp. TaxID=1971397 RepID=UPI002ED9FCA1